MCYPRSKAYEGYVKVFMLQFEIQGSDAFIGMQTPFMLAKSGLKRASANIVQPVLSTPRQRRFLSLGLKERIPGILSFGRMSEAELDAVEKAQLQ